MILHNAWFLCAVLESVVALRWTESDDLSRITKQQIAIWKRQGTDAEILESLSVHLETGRLAVWGAENNVMNDSWIVTLYKQKNCTANAVIDKLDLGVLLEDSKEGSASGSAKGSSRRSDSKRGSDSSSSGSSSSSSGSSTGPALLEGRVGSRRSVWKGGKSGKPLGFVRPFSGKSLTGFTVVCTADQLHDILSDDCVEYVQQDFYAAVDEQEEPDEQVSWSLDLIFGDHEKVNTGENVRIFVLDTPIFSSHPEFGGRVQAGADFAGFTCNVNKDGEMCVVPGEKNCDCGLVNEGSVCSGHGTHVAGVAAGTNVGVATEASIVSVAVMGCDASGAESSVMAGLDYVVDVQINETQISAVVVMSVGGPRPIPSFKDHTLDPKFFLAETLGELGVVVVVAAGNGGDDARYISPAHLPNVVTVCGVDQELKRRTSNYGNDVDICAPGVRIRSASNVNAAGADRFNYSIMSGTSFAAPHVAGSLALILESQKNWTAAEQISELLTECVVEGEVNMDLQNTQTVLHNKLLSFSATCAALQEEWKSPPPVLLPAVRESSVWKLFEGTCQLDGFCMTSPNYPNLYSVYEFCNFTNIGGSDRKVVVEAFDVELGYDFLTVDGYGGQLGKNVVFDGSSGHMFGWYSDSSQAGAGWKLCVGEPSQDYAVTVEVPPTTMPPTVAKAPALLPEWQILTDGQGAPKKGSNKPASSQH